MQKSQLPLLRDVVNNHEIESVLPCSKEQQRALTSGENIELHTILFELRDDGTISVDRLRRAWQHVVQKQEKLRTIFALGLGGIDILQVSLKNHEAMFSHVQYREKDDIGIKVEHEPLPILVPGAPMHVAQLYTAEGSPLLFRLCYNDLVIDDDCLIAIQQDLPLAYQALTGLDPSPTSRLQRGVPDPLLKRMKNAEPSHIGLSMGDTQKTMIEYTYVTKSGCLGETLLLQCSNNGFLPTNMIQALWLILLAKYLHLEQPCCMYRIASDGTSPGSSNNSRFLRREFLCTSLVAGDDYFVDLVKKLSNQTLRDGELYSSADVASTYDSERICNSSVCWYGTTIASGEAKHALRMNPIKAQGSGKHDATLAVIYTGLELKIQLQTGGKVERWLAKSITEMFAQSLEFVLSNSHCKIKDIPSCSLSDIEEMQKWNGGDLPREESCIHDMIREQARLRPDAPAVFAHDGSLSYAELEALTSRVASALFTELSLQHGEKVILQLPHSLWAVVAMISVIKAGSTFVSLDENVPLERVNSIASKASARFVITTSASAASYDGIGLQSIILDQAFVDNRTQSMAENWTSPDVTPSDLAYVIFTSGSTGMPKGCAIEHRAYCSYALTYGPAFRLGPDSRVIQSTSYSFDVSLKEILLGLISGSCLCIPSDYELMNDLGGAAARMQVNYANFTPSVASQLNLESASCIRTLVLGGEALTSSIIAAWVPRVDFLFGGYGPSEVCPTSAVVGPLSLRSNPKNIGQPIGNKAWVVDPIDHNRLVPVGAVGELVLESYAIGRGYIGDDERTAKVFIKNPTWCTWPVFSAADPRKKRRMYKTGDLVARCGDGSLLYFGRKDMQVKLRGQRIELGDIETHLKSLLGVDLVVEAGIPRGGGDEDKILVAFICLGSQLPIPTDLTSIDPEIQANLHIRLGNCEEKLAEKLARYMLPSTYLPLHALPVTTSGKRDRRALQGIIASLRPVVTDMEHQVATLWSQVLKVKVEDLSLDDDFVKRGGDSLAAMRVANMAKEAGLMLTFRDIYRRSRVLSEQVQICLKGPAVTTLRARKEPRIARIPKPSRYRGGGDEKTLLKLPVVMG
ncbi:hypothetical protein NPX13_g1080 [Xylaria arbuscula]|uniref:Carrier domain-containing protein n=1 Tax=Xylaria arbuscula TaxID=114810 RepID=A0A9W8NMQ2_9PEZI|nr:hypothetical protein NPX13_g1080 [Xylaria arbuscula]